MAKKKQDKSSATPTIENRRARHDYHILDTGHFPLEEEGDFIVGKMREFMTNISAK